MTNAKEIASKIEAVYAASSRFRAAIEYSDFDEEIHRIVFEEALTILTSYNIEWEDFYSFLDYKNTNLAEAAYECKLEELLAIYEGYAFEFSINGFDILVEAKEDHYIVTFLDLNLNTTLDRPLEGIDLLKAIDNLIVTMPEIHRHMC